MRVTDRRDPSGSLRARVTLLGRMVGDVLRSHARPGTFEHVERLRALTRERRDAPSDACERTIDEVLDSLGRADAIDVIRAFGLYFQMVNLAEQLHREGRRRERIIAGELPLRGSLETLSPQAAARMDQLEIRLVFTAHPTEVLRRTTSEKLASIARLLRDLDERVLTLDEREGIEAELRAQIVLLWQTNELYRSAPTIDDEVRNLIARFRESLYDESAMLFERLEARTGRPVPSFLSFGSWIGSDRDGNANVAPDAIEGAHEQARRFIITRYVEDVEELQVRFSQDAQRGGVDAALMRSVEADAERMPDVRYAIGPRQEAEPYRRKLAFIHRRLTCTLRDEPGAYAASADLLADLRAVEDSVAAHSGPEVARPLRRLCRSVDVFGFQLCELEWRQHRDRVVAALDEVVALSEPDRARLSQRAPEERAAWFAAALAAPAHPAIDDDRLTPDAADIVASLRAAARLRARRGASSVAHFILAGTEDARDVLTLLVLARAAGALDAGPAQIVPLFESSSSLRNAAGIVECCLQSAGFRAHVRACGNLWEIMLGYSDSTKVAGILSSAWAIHCAQIAVDQAAAAAGITVRFFHGRGGSVGRGAADARDAVAAQPAQSRNARFKVTEQGEVITARYGLPSLARRNLELAVTSVLNGVSGAAAAMPPEWFSLLDDLAERSREAYTQLVGADGFLVFFAQCTPVDEIGELEISSRPGRRGARRSIDDLRAIPWAFGWAQTRGMLPGWYGFGSAVDGRGGDVAVLRTMARDFPFFGALLGSIERALAVADMPIFERYARELVSDEALRERFVSAIRDEFGRTYAAVLAIRDRDTLLADDPILARSIGLRNPYVDPISLLQVRLLREYRAQTPRDPELRDAIRLTINGIAAGLRVTG